MMKMGDREGGSDRMRGSWINRPRPDTTESIPVRQIVDMPSIWRPHGQPVGVAPVADHDPLIWTDLALRRIWHHYDSPGQTTTLPFAIGHPFAIRRKMPSELHFLLRVHAWR